MKKFLAVFLGSEESSNKWEKLDEGTRAKKEEAGIKAWGDWVDKHQKQIAEMGAPLGSTKRVGPKGVSDITNELTAFTVVEAETHEAAAKLFLNHPHFMIFPGDSIEVMECLPIPGMEG